MESGVETERFCFPCVWHCSWGWIPYSGVLVQRVGMWKSSRENHWGTEVFWKAGLELLHAIAILLVSLARRPSGAQPHGQVLLPQSSTAAESHRRAGSFVNREDFPDVLQLNIVLIRGLRQDLFRYSPSFFVFCSKASACGTSDTED